MCLKGQKTFNKENKAKNIPIASLSHPEPAGSCFPSLSFSCFVLLSSSFLSSFFPIDLLSFIFFPLTVSVFSVRFGCDKLRTCAARKIQVINTALSIRRGAQTPL